MLLLCVNVFFFFVVHLYRCTDDVKNLTAHTYSPTRPPPPSCHGRMPTIHVKGALLFTAGTVSTPPQHPTWTPLLRHQSGRVCVCVSSCFFLPRMMVAHFHHRRLLISVLLSCRPRLPRLMPPPLWLLNARRHQNDFVVSLWKHDVSTTALPSRLSGRRGGATAKC